MENLLTLADLDVGLQHVFVDGEGGFGSYFIVDADIQR